MLILLIVLAVILALDLVLLAYDKYWWSFAVFVGTMLAVGRVSLGDSLFTLSLSQWLHYIGYYLAAGVGVALIKWISLTFKVSGRLKDAVAKFEAKYVPPVAQAAINPIVDEGVAGINVLKTDVKKVVEHTEAYLKAHKRDAFFKHIEESRIWSQVMELAHREAPEVTRLVREAEDGITTMFTPKARQYVGKITNWILHWPVVVTWSVFENVLIKLGKHVATLFDTLFGRLGKAIIGRATKGL